MDTDAIKCPTCMKILNLPVILPCGHTICKHHVDEVVESNEFNITCSISKAANINCNICNKSYVIPPNGFVRNRALESLVEILSEREKKNDGFEENLREHYYLATETCKSFEELFDEFKKIKNDPEMQINNVISELRNKVDLKREEMKQKIDIKALALIERIDELEKECKANASNVKSNCKLDEALERLKNDLNETRKSSVTFELVEKWMNIVDESKSCIKEIQSEILKFNESLFLNRLNSFDCMNLSVLNVLFVHFPIRLTIKGLSKYKDSKETEGKDIGRNTLEAFGLELILYVRIMRENGSNEKETYFEVFFGANQIPRIQNVKVDYDLEILDQFRRGKSLKRNFSKMYNSNQSWGTKKFISLKDLLSNYNLYNIKDDSCTVQALIKRIECI